MILLKHAIYSILEKLWPDQHGINRESLVVAVVSVVLARSNFNRGLLIDSVDLVTKKIYKKNVFSLLGFFGKFFIFYSMNFCGRLTLSPFGWQADLNSRPHT